LAAAGVLLRPVRPADRKRIEEISRDVWDGHDYIPRVFDRWVADGGAEFQAAELEGVVVGVQRLRPYAPGLLWYEGLRVATPERRRGIARSMLEAAVEEARGHGFSEVRLATRDEAPRRLFETAGFRKLVEVRRWHASRVEGGEPARIPDAEEAGRLWPSVSSSPGLGLYGGIVPDLNAARDLDAGELRRLAAAGLLRLGPGSRAVALLREPWTSNVAVALIAGSGGALRELLLSLRYEADADDLTHVSLNLPPDHPAEEDLKASGYDVADAGRTACVYSLAL
jgi:GNAT superfamily N-acetyltransferase